MTKSAALHKLATNPAAYARWKMTGQLPRGETPKGPLIDLLRALSPRDRAELRGITVAPPLGYNGSRLFASAEHALRWAAPDTEVFGSFPAKSWQRHGVQRLTLDDLLEHTASFPDNIRARYPRLCRPNPPAATSDSGPGMSL